MTASLESNGTNGYLLPMTQLVNEVKRIFSSSGAPGLLGGFEHRPQQEAMALAVADALESGAHLMVEAPTGVGKTLAYLIPSVLFARPAKAGRRKPLHSASLGSTLLLDNYPVQLPTRRRSYAI